MAVYEYKAKLGADKLTEGSVEAQSLQQAIQKIVQSGFTPLEVVLQGASAGSISVARALPRFQISHRVSLSDLAIFTRQLFDLLDAHVPVIAAMRLVKKQTKNPRFAEIIQEMTVAIENGTSLSQSFRLYPNVFPPHYVQMTAAGEMSGQLPAVWKKLSDFTEKEQEVLEKVRQSLIYPALLFLVGIGTTIVLLTFVIPKIEGMFDDLGADLPMLTKCILFFSRQWVNYIWFFLLIPFVVWWIVRTLLMTPSGRMALSRLVLKLPVWGHQYRNLTLGRLCRILAVLIDSGVEIVAALNSLLGISNNAVIREDIQKVIQDVKQGTSLANAIAARSFFPENMVQMISVGEEAGKLSQSLMKLADMYERRHEGSIKIMLSLLEPLMILFIGCILGTMILGMLLPILQLNTIFK